MIDGCWVDFSVWAAALGGAVGLLGSLAMGVPYLRSEPIAIDRTRLRNAQASDPKMQEALDGLANDLGNHEIMIAPRNLRLFRVGMFGVFAAFLLIVLGHGQQIACGHMPSAVPEGGARAAPPSPEHQ